MVDSALNIATHPIWFATSILGIIALLLKIAYYRAKRQGLEKKTKEHDLHIPTANEVVDFVRNGNRL